MRRLTVVGICVLIGASILGASPAQNPNSVPMTNDDVISLKKAGLGDEVIILRINSGPTRFSSEPADLVALKTAGVSDAVITAMLKSASASAGSIPSAAAAPIDLSRAALVFPFESTITRAEAAGLPDATRTAVIQILKTNRVFSAVLGPEEIAGRKTGFGISAQLVDFAPGNVATRIVVGLGTGRANAGFDFVVMDSTGKVLLKKNVKESASFWSNSASSSAQRSELPEKVAKTFVEELQKAKIPPAAR